MITYADLDNFYSLSSLEAYDKTVLKAVHEYFFPNFLRSRWMDSVMKDLVMIGFRGWRGRTGNRAGWKRVVKATKAHEGL